MHMRTRLPPLNALRAFEAAARSLSFTLAAQELHVTQAAISHQVKALEEFLGTRLFRRATRKLILTEQGQALLPDLRAAFDRMAQAVDRVGAERGAGVLTVSLLTTFALTWLVPRLHDFQEAHPAIEVKLLTTQRLVDLEREEVDLAIRYAKRISAKNLGADKLFDDVLTPLCGPAYRSQLRKPEDLLRLPLIDTTGDPDWEVWFKAARLKPKGQQRRTIFDSTKIAVEAAMEGAGVAIGPPYLFADELKSGRLFQPFLLTVPNGKAFWLVYRKAAIARPRLRAFRDWMLGAIAADRTLPPSSKVQAKTQTQQRG